MYEVRDAGDNNRVDSIYLKPVGVVRSDIKRPVLTAKHGDLHSRCDARRHREDSEQVSELVIDEGLAGSGILDGIEEYSHLVVLYWPHLGPPEGRSLMQGHPMGRKDFPQVGIFATCSPARPNPILMTTVRLVERRGNVLRVTGLDAVDGSPIIDIKPYVPVYHRVKDLRMPEWMLRIHREFNDDEVI
jgi:tRNA-Thr(GGU) m(6)t(6)A37 methyltransferase TsaA